MTLKMQLYPFVTFLYLLIYLPFHEYIVLLDIWVSLVSQSSQLQKP